MQLESLLPGVEEFLMAEEMQNLEEEYFMTTKSNNNLNLEDAVYLRMSERERKQYENLSEERQERFLQLIAKTYEN